MLDLDRQNHLRERYRQLHPAWRPATETYAALVRSYLNPTSRILDLGCGRGGLIEQLNHPPRLITGVDPDWLSLSEHRLQTIGRVSADSEWLPFRSQSFDLVVASWLLEHLSDPAGTLRQIQRVLKPGGALLFITPNSLHPVAYLNRLLGRMAGLQGFIVRLLYGREPEDTFPTHYRANSPEQLNQLAHEAGLELATMTSVPDPTYLAFNDTLFPYACSLEDNLPRSRSIHLVGALRRPG